MKSFALACFAVLLAACGGTAGDDQGEPQCPPGRVIDLDPHDQNPQSVPDPGHCEASLPYASAPWCCDPLPEQEAK